MNKKVAVVGLAVALVLGVGGAAFAYFTSAGAGTGSSGVGLSSNLIINQLGNTVIYNSTISPLPGNIPSYGAEAYAFNQIGNEVNLASTSPLNNVVVTMSSFTCESLVDGLCTTTPGATFPVPITFNIYNEAVGGIPGTLIATDTQTFNIPYRPSYSPSHCGLGPYNVGQWYDAATNTCYNGLANNITFNFSPQDITLPSTVVYGIVYSSDHYGPNPTEGSSNPADSLNVAFTTASTDVSVGSDAIPGDIFINSGYATNLTIFCTTVTVDTFMAANDDCDAVSGTPPMYDIPAVQFNTAGAGIGDLYPGGASQPINFSVTNPGGGDEFISSVTITVSSISQTAAGSLLGTCNPAWFGITQPTEPINVTIPPGGTLTYDPSGASIALGESHTDQDMCQGATVNLAFTSS
jgi:hypothetical protein